MTTTFTNQAAIMTQNYDTANALLTLSQGGLILFPTDTTWSIGCDALNPQALKKLLHLHQQKNTSPVELLVNSIGMIKSYVAHLHPRVETLLVFHTRPLTLLLEHARRLPAEALHPDGSVAMRLTQDEFTRLLVGQFGQPIATTPACVEGQPYPTHFGAISSTILQGVDHVSKFRQHDKNQGELSVMVKLSDGDEELVFLRE
jgi:L-threonylcarbamoyladenylate synthase